MLAVLLAILLAGVFIYDFFIRRDNILRNFPVIGHFRYLWIELGPELRQYIVAGNRKEAPFNWSGRGWIYRPARGQNNYFGFGTDDQIYGIGCPIIKHAIFPHGEVSFTASIHDKPCEISCAKILGETHNRKKAWRPSSVINIPVMSFGSLGAIGSGKLGFPDRAVVAFALGADLINIAREAMLAIGCIQAQKCHTDRCPAGITTHNGYLQRGLDFNLQSQRLARFV